MDRFLDRVNRYDPEVAVIGDAYSRDEASRLQAVADDLEDTKPVIVPKCREALDAIDDDTVVGYANGYSDIKPEDFSKPHGWRGRRVHLLGGSPSAQYQVIQSLTQPTLDDAEPADIVGLDGNCAFKVAYKGEYWTPRGWQSADHLTIRETVERSLQEMKAFWQTVGVWPDQEPRYVYGPAVEQPDEQIWLDRGGDPITDRDGLERSYIAEYEEIGMVAFKQDSYRKFVEYRDGCRSID